MLHLCILGRVSVTGNRHLILMDPIPAVSYQWFDDTETYP